jgi:hypothetical protein
MNKESLFRELTDETATILYIDGFGEFGERVLVGKNQIRDYYAMATSFYMAAEELRKIVLANYGLHLFRYEYPMFFLYRHAIELYIKATLPRPGRGHNLEQLLSDFVKHIKDRYALDISKGWFVETLREFSKIDPSSQSFRYPKDLSGNSTMSGDFFVNVKAWGETMEKVSSIFVQLHLVQGEIKPNKKTQTPEQAQ